MCFGVCSKACCWNVPRWTWEWLSWVSMVECVGEGLLLCCRVSFVSKMVKVLEV